MDYNEYQPTDREREAITILLQEKSNWQEGTVWITPKVTFDTKKMVEKCRKNYFGIFNEANDPMTNRQKIFIPFTEWVIESILKNIDIDTKDITVKAKNPSAYAVADIYRYVIRKKLDDINFGQIINKLLKRVCIDGTGFLKIFKDNGKLGIYVIDRLNMMYDPSAETLDQSSGIIERNVLTLPEFQEYKNWDNVGVVKGTTTLDRTGFDLASKANIRTTVPYVEVFERYGYVPKWIVTDDEADKDSNEYVYALIIASGLSSQNQTVIHLIKEVSGHPYQEFKFKEVPNRLDGRGPAEMLMNIQAYINEVVNTRLNAGRMVHQKLWKIRGNVTPQQLSNFFATAAIKLDANSDIEMVNTGSIDPSSYRDEEQAYFWGNQVTQSVDDQTQGGNTATEALIGQQAANKAYNLRIEDIFLNLEKAFAEKIVPIINKELSKEEIIRITGDVKDIKRMDEKLAKNYVYNTLNKEMKEKGMMSLQSTEEVEAAIDSIASEMENMGEDRPIPKFDELFDTKYDIKITITDETINKATIAQALQNIMGIAAQAGKPIEPIMSELFDTLGFSGERMIAEMEKQPQQQPQQIGQGQQLTPEQQAGMMQEPPMPGNSSGATM